MLLLIACNPAGDDSAAPPDIAAEVTRPGPWGVGYREDSVTYEAPTGARTLRLATWYPTEASSGTSPTYGGFYPAGTGVYADAAPAEGSFPLAIFSHGHQGYAESSSFLMEHLASHGWRVLAPDHTGNTTFDGDDRTTEIYFERPLDLAALVEDAPFVAALGHSFGGYTVFALAGAAYADVCPADTSYCSTMTGEWQALFDAGFRDDRFGTFVSMAPGDYELFGEGLGAIAAPVLHLSASEDDPDAQAAIHAALADGDDLRVDLVGGGHQSFTDFADTFEDVPLSAEEGWRIVDAFVLAWVDVQAGDDRYEGVLDGSIPISEAARVEVDSAPP